MKSVFIYGISGDIGSRVAKLLSNAGCDVSGLVRNAKKSQIMAEKGIRTFTGSIDETSPEKHAEWLKGIDTVLFTAGARSEDEEKVRAIDYQGVADTAAASVLAGVHSYVLISAFPEAGRQRETSAGFETYMSYKKQADAWLINSSAPWTIIRPGRLVDTEPTGQVQAALALPYEEISREDLANFISDVIRTDIYRKQIIEVTGK
ncbi:NAD-dependent dehydratase [Rahnella sp. AA]|uniref:NAD(P)H-binding protein n=1 Tax=Rahnella sp. AA TaxID=2057180 RepID=UPI000C337754|nr:NAD(P)H-binding protein [Rahnella sp. AA]PKE30169.1 NAD-dependent dehydratase [Rahnella sp. AA]